jgi:nucleoside-triphosphatase THEP1
VFATEHGGGSRVLRSNELVGAEHLAPFLPLFDGLDRAARRAGVDGTLHRISRSIHAVGAEPIAITARVGRTLQGQILPMLLPQPTAPQPSWLPRTAHHDEAAASLAVATLASRSLLLIGPPNVGKTTALRELARLLSLSDKLVVVIVDKSLEIAGTAQVPHAAIGNARVLTAESPQHQHRAMLEAVENQSPDVIIIDEISTKEECQAARTIAGRGVALVASVHGDSLAGLIGDAERSVLIGGIQAVTLSAREAAARADGRRTVQRRYGPPVFGAAIELRGFGECVVHSSVEKAVDALLDHTTCEAWWHRVKPGSPRNADEGSGVVVATPVVAVPCEGRAPAYAALSKGARVEAETDLMALSSMVPAQWVAESSITPLVYARRT